MELFAYLRKKTLPSTGAAVDGHWSPHKKKNRGSVLYFGGTVMALVNKDNQQIDMLACMHILSIFTALSNRIPSQINISIHLCILAPALNHRQRPSQPFQLITENLGLQPFDLGVGWVFLT